jgi:energy-coupling factor transport system ATP-binding protein
MGRNGAGKSTLLKCIVNLLAAERGEVWLNGRSIRNRSVADICREVAYLPQNPDDLLFADTVGEELAMTLKNHGRMETRDWRVESGGLLGELGLAEYRETYPRDLSVGQRQRVALGAVMVTQPSLLLLDEPTRGLDSKAKENLVTIWQQWVRRGMGLLLVTHDVGLVMQMANRVIILDEGTVVAQGETAGILAHFYPEAGWLRLEDVLDVMRDT